MATTAARRRRRSRQASSPTPPLPSFRCGTMTSESLCQPPLLPPSLPHLPHPPPPHPHPPHHCLRPHRRIRRTTPPRAAQVVASPVLRGPSFLPSLKSTSCPLYPCY